MSETPLPHLPTEEALREELPARMALFARHLSAEQAGELQRRQLAQLANWPPLLAELRAVHAAGLAVDEPVVRDIAQRWQALFRAAYFGDDAVLEARVRDAFTQEPALTGGGGLDAPLLAYIQRAILSLHLRPQAPADLPAGPKPSARLVAVSRAVHQLLDRPLILDDPLALRILGPQAEAELRSQPQRYDDPVSRVLRTTLVVRSRLAADEWAAAALRGTRQCVILGAGLDTTAYRSDAPAAGSRCFEVDLPSTQQWKRERLREAGIAEPAWLSYVPTDFEAGTLAEALAQAGFDHRQPAFFSWLGVVMYLDADAIAHTLRTVAGCAPGSSLVFDYLLVPELLSPMDRIGMEMVTARMAEQGEAWKSFFDPARLVAMLQACGFSQAQDVDGPQLAARYLAGRSDGLRLAGSTRLMLARV